jgi:glucose/arabinose dehydrogenase
MAHRTCGVRETSPTEPGRIRVLRAADGAAKPSSNDVFASGLDQPFGIAFYPSGSDPQWVYVANTGSVVRYPYRSGDLKARGKAEVINAASSSRCSAARLQCRSRREGNPTAFEKWEF